MDGSHLGLGEQAIVPWTHEHLVSLPDDATREQTSHHGPHLGDGVDFVHAELCHLLFEVLLLVEVLWDSVEELPQQIKSPSSDT